jgi:hypothetical protein
VKKKIHSALSLIIFKNINHIQINQIDNHNLAYLTTYATNDDHMDDAQD